MAPALPDRTDGVNDVPRNQVEPRRDAALPRRTTDARPHFRAPRGTPVQLTAGAAVNRAIHPAAAKHLLVRRVDDHVERRAS